MALLIYRGQMLIILFNHFSAAVAHSLSLSPSSCQLCVARGRWESNPNLRLVNRENTREKEKKG